MRARRIMAGFRRIGVAMILGLPVFCGLATWLALGQAPPGQVYLFLAAGLGANVLATSIGWIIVGFTGEDEPLSPESVEREP